MPDSSASRHQAHPDETPRDPHHCPAIPKLHARSGAQEKSSGAERSYVAGNSCNRPIVLHTTTALPPEYYIPAPSVHMGLRGTLASTTNHVPSTRATNCTFNFIDSTIKAYDLEFVPLLVMLISQIDNRIKVTHQIEIRTDQQYDVDGSGYRHSKL